MDYFTYGDEIYFSHEIPIQKGDNTKIKTYLFADPLDNVMWDIPPKKYDLPIDFDNSLFVLCPKLSYVDQESIYKLSNESDLLSNELSYVDQDDVDDDAIEEYMERRREISKQLSELEGKVLIERTRNQNILTTSKGSQILYGSIVQIMHKKTGKFLCFKYSCAKNDKACLRLELSEGHSQCHFTLYPKYKFREGGPVLLNDEIMVSAVLSPVLFSSAECAIGYYLHGSPPENDDASSTVKVENFNAYKSKSGFNYFEANLSNSSNFKDSGIIVSLHARSLDESKYLRTGDAVSFYVPDAEAFIQVSEEEQLSKNSIKINVGTRLDCKTHPSSFDSRTVWALEKQDRRSGGLIEYKTVKYRIRHIPTSKYLTVTESFVSAQDAMFSSESKYKLDLLDSEEKDISKISQLFTLNYASKASTYVPNEEVHVFLSHTNKSGEEYFLHVHQEGKIEKNVDVKRLVLHSQSTKKRTNKGLVRNATVTVLKAGDDSEEYRGEIFQDNYDDTYDIIRSQSDSRSSTGETQLSRFIYVSNKKRDEDALILVAAGPEKQEIVDFLRLVFAVCESYLKFVKDESAAGKELSISGKKTDFDSELLVLRKLVRGSLGYTGYESDDSRVGRPYELFQNAARTQKVLDGCFKVVCAPVLASPLISMEKSGIDDSWMDPRFEHIADVHSLAWQAISHLVKGNSKSAHYVTNLKATTKMFGDLQTLQLSNEVTTTRRLSSNKQTKAESKEQEVKGIGILSLHYTTPLLLLLI